MDFFFSYVEGLVYSRKNFKNLPWFFFFSFYGFIER